MKAKPNWLLNDVTNICFVFGAGVLLKMGISIILVKFGAITDDKFFNSKIDPDLLYGCTLAPILEELIFRLLPISAFIIVIKYFPKIEKLKWHFIAFLAIIFGLAHNGYWSIYLQGVGGFLYGWLYFKNKYGYPSAVIAHSLWNLFLGFILPMVGDFSVHTPFNFFQ